MSISISYQITQIYTETSTMQVAYEINGSTVTALLNILFTSTNGIYSVVTGTELNTYLQDYAPVEQVTKQTSIVDNQTYLLSTTGTFTAT